MASEGRNRLGRVVGLWYRPDHDQLRMYRKAVEDYTTCLELAPFRSEFYKKRAFAEFRLKDYDGALANLAGCRTQRRG